MLRKRKRSLCIVLNEQKVAAEATWILSRTAALAKTRDKRL